MFAQCVTSVVGIGGIFVIVVVHALGVIVFLCLISLCCVVVSGVVM